MFNTNRIVVKRSIEHSDQLLNNSIVTNYNDKSCSCQQQLIIIDTANWFEFPLYCSSFSVIWYVFHLLSIIFIFSYLQKSVNKNSESESVIEKKTKNSRKYMLFINESYTVKAERLDTVLHNFVSSKQKPEEDR